MLWPALAVLAAVVPFAVAQDEPRGGPKLRRQFPITRDKERRPNIVLIMTDDQDVELGSLNFMPKTLRLLRDGGAEFRHAYTTTPMCCPSRSSMLTGMYMHNHNVYTNNGNCSSAQWQATHETRTFATYLSNAGYRTGYFGKYLNKYNGSYIPPGWREWGGLIMNSRYYNYSVNLNGKKIKHGDDYHKDYYPDLIANDSVAFLRQSKKSFSRKPVMLVLGFPAPHGPEDSAPQFSELFFNVTTHHTPSYDFAPNPDKQWILQVTGQMQPIHRQFTDLLMTKRLQTLQSVDHAVDKVYRELEALGELDNTYIIYTSDHGYHLGQFGLVKGKSFPFEFDVRVPFLVRGPGIEPGTIIDELVLNIDLAPTFLDIAGVESPGHMDGRSFLKLLNRRHKPKMKYPSKWPDTFLIESSGRRDYPEFLGEAKLQESISKIEKDLNHTFIGSEKAGLNNVTDLELNPELKRRVYVNLFGEIVDEDFSQAQPKVEPGNDAQLDNRLVPVLPGMNKMQRLAAECQRPEFQAPCKPGQKWQCLPEGKRWRKHKCKLRLSAYPKGKKCACFTPKGIMYTRIEPDERRIQREFSKYRAQDYRPKFLKRARRSGPVAGMDMTDVILQITPGSEKNKVELVTKDEETEPETEREAIRILNDLFKPKDLQGAINKLMAAIDGGVRSRRSVDNLDTHVSTIMGVLEDKINVLEVTSNSSVFKISNQGNCTVGTKGQVSCSETVYHNPKAWKASRDQLEEQIKKLKSHLDKLKEIRRHLKEKRPIPFDRSIEEEDEDRSSGTTEDFTTLFNSTDEPLSSTKSPVTVEVKPKNKHRHHHTFSVTEESPYPLGQDDTAFKPNSRGYANGGRVDFGIHDVLPPRPKFLPDTCYCEPDLPPYKNEKDLAREARRKIKEERARRKERKMRKKAKMESECLSEKMNCFNHDNEHWKTPPLWTVGPFCFCMNANNNTYSCIRTINATHNFLYCEFVTGLVTYYNLRIDPFEQWNRFNTLTSDEKSNLHDQLEQLKGCRGVRDCTVGSAQASYAPSSKQPKRRRFHTGVFVPSFYTPSFSRIFKQPPSNLYGPRQMNREWRKRHNGAQWKTKRRQNFHEEIETLD